MKKIIIVIVAAIFSVNLYAGPIDGGVNDKVLKSFNETFVDAQQVKWSEFKDNYVVSFYLSGILTRVAYDRNGEIIFSLRYYLADTLPETIFNSLKRKYSHKKWLGVTEASAGDNIAYFVRMQDEKNFYTIRVDSEGTSEVYEKYLRADRK